MVDQGFRIILGITTLELGEVTSRNTSGDIESQR